MIDDALIFQTKPNMQENNGNWVIVRPAIDDPIGNKYTIKHALEGLSPGKYAAKLRARNTHGWSELSEQHFFDGGEILYYFYGAVEKGRFWITDIITSLNTRKHTLVERFIITAH